MVNDAEFLEIISWDQEGTVFKIKRISMFERKALKKYFRHTKFESFHRQLNNYGFSRVYPVGLSRYKVFKHQHFKEGHEQELALITRFVEQVGNNNQKV